MIALILVRSFLKKYKDGVILFYDSEFGTPRPYFNTLGIDMKRVFHVPLVDIEELKQDLMAQLKDFKRGEHVMVLVDSIGMLASAKEVDDTLEKKQVADMTRAKSIKSLFRMITPRFKIKDIPLVVVNHIYMEQGMYPKAIVSGGTGSYLASDNIWVIGRQQEKVKEEIGGWNFILNVEKSRFVKEKSKLPITVMFEGGVETYSGLLDNAIEAGFIDKVTPGWYLVKGGKTKLQKKDMLTADFWDQFLTNEAFHEFFRKKFKVSYGSIMESDQGGDSVTED
jgi:RecA/RadA recombinase